MRLPVALLAAFAYVALGCSPDQPAGPSDAGAVADGSRPDATADASGDAASQADGGADASRDAASDAGFVGFDGALCGYTPSGVTVDAGADAAPYDVLLDTGGGFAVGQNATRVLSAVPGRYTLWDIPSKMQLARGSTAADPSQAWFRPVLAGSSFIVQQNSGFEIRDTSDAHVVFTIPTSSGVVSAGLALDGSYVWATSTSWLTIFSPTGTILMRQVGAYAGMVPFAAPGELRVAKGPAGNTTIELFAAPSGTRTAVPFQGAFAFWFDDGARFLSDIPGVQRVYTTSGALQGTFSFTSAVDYPRGGLGSYLWSSSDTELKFYSVTGNGTADATFPVGSRAAATANIVYFKIAPVSMTSTTFGIVTAGSSGLMKRTYTVPTYGGELVLGPGGAMTVNSSPMRYEDPANPGNSGSLGCGAILDSPSQSLRGSGASGTASLVALGLSAQTVVLDVGAAAPRVANVFDFGSASVQIDANGAVLAASPVRQSTVELRALPGGALIHSFPSDSSGNFTLASGGTRIGWHDATGARHAADLTGSVQTWSDPGGAQGWESFGLSPNGKQVAASTRASVVCPADGTTSLYADGVLVKTVNGQLTGWLDDGRVLVAQYGFTSPSCPYSHSSIYDAAGNLLSVFNPVVYAMDPLPNNRIFSRTDGAIYDLATGQKVWDGGAVAGTVAGSYIIYAYGSEVRRARYR